MCYQLQTTYTGCNHTEVGLQTCADLKSCSGIRFVPDEELREGDCPPCTRKLRRSSAASSAKRLSAFEGREATAATTDSSKTPVRAEVDIPEVVQADKGSLRIPDAGGMETAEGEEGQDQEEVKRQETMAENHGPED